MYIVDLNEADLPLQLDKERRLESKTPYVRMLLEKNSTFHCGISWLPKLMRFSCKCQANDSGSSNKALQGSPISKETQLLSNSESFKRLVGQLLSSSTSKVVLLLPRENHFLLLYKSICKGLLLSSSSLSLFSVLDSR